MDYNTQRLNFVGLEKYQIKLFFKFKKLKSFSSVGKSNDHLPKFKWNFS